ncbi:MAG: ABC transporter permease [Marinoscillum sp.]
MINPPKWATKFLRWYCNPDLLEEIEGDIYELFDRRIEEKGAGFAKRKFLWDTLRFFRWSNIKRTHTINQRSNAIIMLRNYLHVGFRNMTRYWVTSSINIFGLALALATLITLFIFIDMQQNMDNYHTNTKKIYQVVNNVKSEGELELWGDSPVELGSILVENHSQVEEMFRVEYQYANVKYEDNVFNELLVFTDPGFLKMLDFSVLAGDRNTLEKRDHIVISYDMAEKYFALEDPVGKLLTLKFGSNNIKTFTVGAVLEKYPYNSSMRFNFLLPMEQLRELQLVDKFDWSYFTDATFIMLKDGADPLALTEQADQYISTQNSFDPEWKVESFELISLETLCQQSHRIRSAVAGGSHPAGQIALGIIAILLTVLACFNYMNISVAASTKRLKEIALRKVVGSNRGAITVQFLVENLIQVFVALIIGTLIGYFLFMPGLNSILPFSVPFRFASIPMMVVFFLSILILVGVVSSLYPALYVSRFQPVSIFRGNTKFGTKNVFSKVLLAFQLTFAFTTVVGCFLFTDNAVFQKNQEWGYEGEGILSLTLNDPSQYSALNEFASANPLVAEFVGSANQLCIDYNVHAVHQRETEVRSVVFNTHANYPQMMRMKLKEGQWINGKLDAANNPEILINEQFVKKMGWDQPIGERLTVDSTLLTVVGVVENFQYQSWFGYDQLLPSIIKVTPEENYQYAIFKSTPGNLTALDASLKALWLDVAPNDPYDRVIQSNAYDQFFNELDGNIVVINVISAIAIVLAALGLFGLLSFNIQSRIKEFSVRKILGATTGQIIKIASKQYFWIVGIGFVLGAPAGFFMINSLIQSVFPNPKPVGLMPFILSMLIMALTLAFTITGQLIKASHVNPAENLRNE